MLPAEARGPEPDLIRPVLRSNCGFSLGDRAIARPRGKSPLNAIAKIE